MELKLFGWKAISWCVNDGTAQSAADLRFFNLFSPESLMTMKISHLRAGMGKIKLPSLEKIEDENSRSIVDTTHTALPEIMEYIWSQFLR